MRHRSTHLDTGLPQRHEGRAPASRFRRRILKVRDEARPREDRADDLALDSDAAAVDDAERFEAGVARFDEVFLDYRLHVAGRDGVEIEDVGDGNADRLVHKYESPTGVTGRARWVPVYYKRT